VRNAAAPGHCKVAAVIKARPAVISLTPMALEKDSRTFKFAVSFKRFGYRSLVLEGAPSTRDFSEYGIEVRSLGGSSSMRPPAESLTAKYRHQTGSLAHPIMLAGYLTKNAIRYFVRPFFRLPRADLYYVHSYEYLPLVLFRRRGARCIYDAHDFYQGILSREHYPEFDRDYVLPALGRIEKAAARRCDAVVTVSAGTADALETQLGVRAHVVMNAVDRRLNRPVALDIRSALRLNAEDRLMVMVGNKKPGIPMDYVAALMRNLPPNFHIAFLGGGYREDAPDTETRARLHYIEPVAPTQVTAFISAADLGLLLYMPISPNYKHALPNGFFHLVDAGLPIARFDMPDVEGAIQGLRLGPLLDPVNPEQAAQYISSFLSDDSRYYAARSAARGLAESIDWEAQEKTIAAIIGIVDGTAGETMPHRPIQPHPQGL
jgi:glycosyltransferase involved in cell wall biosynthesis